MEQQLQELSQRLTIIEAKFQAQIDDLQQKFERAISDRKEVFYQKHLEKVFKGKHTKTRHGITDIETEDSIIEIKCWKNYKNVVGQLKAYAFDQKTKKCLVAAFYGGAPETYKENAIEYINSEKINVIELIDCADGNIVIKQLGQNIKLGAENAQQSTNTITDNTFIPQMMNQLIQDSGYVLNKIIVKRKFRELFSDKPFTNELSRIIEKEIMNRYNIEYKRSRYINTNYKGWLGLRFKTKEELDQQTE